MRCASALLPLVFASASFAADPFSYSTPAEVAVTHVDLDLRVGFAPRELVGTAVLRLARSAPEQPQELVLDSKDLHILRVECADSGRPPFPLVYELGPADPILGSALRVSLAPGVEAVRIGYRAGAAALALQWLEGPQTGGRRPFLYSQSGTIHARSWLPVQDSPGVRFTWEATVRVPSGLRPVMSGTRVPTKGAAARFRMSNPVPAYLIGLAVGDLAFRRWSARAGVFAERAVVARAHREFRDVPRMLEIAERLFGPYRWDRYDVLVMPPAFPYSGVENAQLSFVTPTLLVGDRSQVSTVAHEVAHSWAGNLVTQETWNDVWLNEGLAVYLERRIVEELCGPERAAAESVLGRQRLIDELPSLAPEDQRLRVRFNGRDPDQALSNVPYEKGFLFFLRLEREAGRARLDAFLRSLFQDFAFRSIDTDGLLERLHASLPGRFGSWIDEPGLPSDAPSLGSPALEEARQVASAWSADDVRDDPLPAGAWSAEQWTWFVSSLPSTVRPARLRVLDEAWALGRSANPAILVPWLRLGIRSGYAPALARAEELLRSVGRGSILLPIYDELLGLPDGTSRAARTYCRARGSYHPVVAAALDRRIRCGGPN